MSYISSNFAEAEALLQTLEITYTEFFRNPLIYAYLEKWILPRLANEKSDGNELRIWATGCSSGQEPYSIAMLLEEYNASVTKNCDIAFLQQTFRKQHWLRPEKANTQKI